MGSLIIDTRGAKWLIQHGYADLAGLAAKCAATTARLQMRAHMECRRKKMNTLEARNDLVEFAIANYADEIDALAAEYTAKGSGVFFCATPEMHRAAAEINISRLHSPAEWARIDAEEAAATAKANNDD